MPIPSPRLPVAVEHIFICKECGHNEAWTTERAAQAAGVWHVHDMHRSIWFALAGSRPPIDPRPVELGRQLEDWERQS